jgi:hypothetical protein
MRSIESALTAGRGRAFTTSPPGQHDQGRPLLRAAGRRPRATTRCSLSIRWSVTHESHTPRGIKRPSGRWVTREGEWHSPQTVSRGKLRVSSGTEFTVLHWSLATCHAKTKQNPYGSQSWGGPGSGCRVARRRAGGLGLQPVARRPAAPSRGRCGGPIGVVKLLRARGGCLGVIRIRAWKAAKSPGELPNERRARNARGDPGN